MGRYGILGWYKSHGGGENAIFTAEEVERFKELVKNKPENKSPLNIRKFKKINPSPTLYTKKSCK